jgi:hypothetical protein
MTRIHLNLLKNLRDSQGLGLSRSSIPKGCGALVEALETCGAAEFRPAVSGRGVKLVIKSQNSFIQFVSSRAPLGLDVDLDQISDRATSVFMLADAKQFRTSVGQGIFVRSIRPETILTTGNDDIDVSELTIQAGGMGIQLVESRNWSFKGRVAVVENADCFWKHELVLPEVDLAVFGSGQMSHRLLNWLSSTEMADCPITHWGDYDPVGVWEYYRLTQACPGRVAPFVPSTLDELLERHGKRRLIIRQHMYLDRLRSITPDPYIKRMIGLFDNHRKGLEQEIFLLSPFTVKVG